MHRMHSECIIGFFLSPAESKIEALCEEREERAAGKSTMQHAERKIVQSSRLAMLKIIQSI